jgi:hypothetical protein
MKRAAGLPAEFRVYLYWRVAGARARSDILSSLAA